MCGICGIIGRDSKDEGAGILARMLHSIHHRGPDEEGTLIAPRFAAGTRRLSIIDLAGGSQPIWNEIRTLAVHFNGEIYNFQQLRDELIAAGHKFHTRSDTEVIVHVYEQWGPEGFARLHGMFAFVLAEMPEGPSGPVTRAILARDRFGIKPIYYAAMDGALVFASEVRALLASGVIPAQISAEAIASYLLFGSVCEPTTLIGGVFSLPPGHFAEIPVSGPITTLRSKPFWRGVFSTCSSSSTSSNSSPQSLVRTYLDQAVRSHLIADVPVGVFLSSGLDSTAIAALAAKAHPGIHTFTVAFPDVEFSEASEARRTAERLGTQHCELQLSGDEMLARIEEAVAAFDQPSMDGINTYFVSWASRQAGLKVALSGLGSDEIFGGYPTFRTVHSVARLCGLAHLFPEPIRRLGASFAKFGKHTASREKALAAWLAPEALPHPYFFTRALFAPEQLPQRLQLLAGEVNSDASSNQDWRSYLAEISRQAGQMDGFNAVSWLELRSYMLNTLLRDTDAMSMAHSLEVRVPFLDPPLVDFVLSLPESQKRGAHPKSLLIGALGNLLPQNVASQVGKRKRTFTFPWENWLRGALRERVSAGLGEWSPAVAPVLGREFAQRVWEEFQRGHTTWSRPWSLYVLNEWAKRYLDGNGAVAGVGKNCDSSREETGTLSAQ